MRAVGQRTLTFTLVGLAAVLSGRAFAQSEPTPAADNRLESAAAEALISDARKDTEVPDEVTVQGKKGNQLGKYHLEMVKAREGIVEAFNKVNENKDNDVTCRTEKPTGSRLGHSVCRSKSEDAADAKAARGFLTSLLNTSGGYITNTRGAPPPPGGTQVNANIGTAGAQQGGASGEAAARAQLETELKRLMGENRDLYRAVIKYVDARDDYNKARGAGTVVLDGKDPLAEGAPSPQSGP